jgi:hypothetical protein
VAQLEFEARHIGGAAVKPPPDARAGTLDQRIRPKDIGAGLNLDFHQNGRISL